MDNEQFLNHYGVLGMHWGHHKSQKEILSKSRTSNLDSWGKTPDNNILYVTGYSGSGKSTIARSLADKNTNVIHLDVFLENVSKKVANSERDKEFVNFLDKHFPQYKDISKPSNGKPRDNKWFDKVDELMLQSEKFGEHQFKKNKKVIVEGVQLLDSTTYVDKKFFKDKPLIITGTNPITSYLRASKRDGKPIIKSVQSTKEYIWWYNFARNKLNSLSKITNAKVGKKHVDKFLKEHGDKSLSEIRG